MMKVTLWGVVAGELLAELEDCDILVFVWFEVVGWRSGAVDWWTDGLVGW